MCTNIFLYICTHKNLYNMKTRNLFLSAAAISMIAVSCAGSGESHTEEATPVVEETTAAPATWVVDTEA